MRVVSLADFGTDRNILIEGIAGQGKSVFLRYLCAVELARGQYLPVFVELQRIEEKQPLIEAILAAARALGLALDAEAFKELAASGRILLLLDAFDEVREDAKTRVLREIEDLATSHDKLRIIVTSRLDSGLAACPQLRVCRLSNLEKDEYKHVIYKLLDDEKQADGLIDQVSRHHGGMQNLLSTPLLVTLLVIRYKSYQDVPTQLSEFYDSLFIIMLQRHDGTKPGYKRPRACPLNDYQYRLVFDALCFFCKRLKGKQLDYKRFYSIVEQAIHESKLEVSPDKYLSDIISITCLLVKDGEELRFIHGSVQEYYAASFIRSKPDKVAIQVYDELFRYPAFVQWRQELRFLQEIDPYRYDKFGVLRFLCGYFNASDKDFLGPVSAEAERAVRTLLEEVTISLQFHNGQWFASGTSYRACVLRMLDTAIETQTVIMTHSLRFQEASEVITTVAKVAPLASGQPDSTSPRYICLQEITSRGHLNEQFDQLVRKVAEMYWTLGRETVERIAAHEADDAVLGLFDRDSQPK